MLSAVHPALADSRGVKVFWRETVFSVAIAVVVTVSMTWVGLLVINSLLVLPAAAAPECGPRTMFQYHLVSPAGGGAGRDRGADDLSHYVGSSAGAAITLYLAVWFLGTFPGPEKAVNKTAGGRLLFCCVKFENPLVLQGALKSRLGGAGRDTLEGIVSKGPAVGTGGHDAFLVTDHLFLVKGRLRVQ